MSKKKYLIVIALIIFVFLAVFTFANPSNTEEVNENDALEELDKDVTNKDNEEDKDVYVPLYPVYNNHGVNIENVSRLEDATYEIALKAVIKAESTITESDYEEAKDLVNKVLNLDKKEELEERLEEVFDLLDLKNLVEELVEKTNSAESKKELVNARKYQISNEIIDRVNELMDSEFKALVVNDIKSILGLLNDEEEPIVNIEDGAVFTHNIVLNVEDESEVIITLTKKDEESKEIENNTEITDGVYELHVMDVAFNEVTINFVVDTTPAVIKLAGTKGLNKNEYRVESGTNVTVEDIMATVVDNIDGESMIKPYKAVLLISNVASENDYNYNFTDGFKTNYAGRYNLYYEYIDNAGNKSTAVMLLVMKDTTAPTIALKGTEGRNSNELRVSQDDVVTLDDVTATVTDNVDATKEIDPVEIRRYYPRETGKASHLYDATNGFDTTTPGYYTINYEAVDSSNNKSTKQMLLVVKLTKAPTVIDGKADLYGNLTLIDQPFYNEVDVDEDIVIDGHGYTVTQKITSEDKFDFLSNGTRPTMGNMFASKNGEKITVNNITFAGTTHTISLGQYRDTKSNIFNTEFNNVNIIGLKVASYSSNIGQAVVVLGNATLNNTNIYGTKRTSLESGPNWPLYDLAVVNYTTTIINGGKIGSIYSWAKARMEIYNAEIDTIFTNMRKVTGDFDNGGLIIGSGTTVNKITVNNKSAIVTIKDGAVVDTLDFNGLDQTKMTITIEPGAVVNNIIN